MTNKKKLHSLPLALLVLFFLILGSSITSAGTETRLTHGAPLTDSTAIYGNIVTWSETAGNGVHVYDLAAGKEVINVGTVWAGKIPVYGNKIVWVDMEENVRVYDISTDNWTTISSDGSSPDIYGDYVVYTNSYYSQNRQSGIYLYDLNTYNETKIAAVHSYPAIYDRKVVWSQANSSNGYDICIYDISTHQTSTIRTTNSSSFESQELDIYGNVVVWTELHNVYMYDMASHKITQVTNSENAHQPAIYGKRIVYAVGKLYSGDIYTYDISTAKTTRITTSTRAFSPSIYEDKIVYADSRDSEYGDARDIYLYDLSSTVENPPIAEFTANVTSGTAPLVVLFTDTSTGGVPASWHWDTGDGIYSKHAMNATHTFTKPGVYNVTLTVANEAGNSTVTKLNYITVTSPQALVADFFSPQVDKARSNLDSVKNETLLFIDNSTGSPTSWLWDFGDGTISTVQNPTHAYTNEGGYTVTLTVKNAIGSSTVSKYGYALVRMDEGGIIAPAYFSSNVTSGIVPLTVLFHDTTFPDVNGDYAYGREWDFGDMTNYSDDYDENNSTYITHTYKKPGKYTVKLRSYDIGGGCIITKYNYITVIDPNAPVANFSSNITEGYAPLTVQFYDLSQKATSRTWDFDSDGQIDSSDISPIYVYANAGTYTVNLTVNNGNGTASKTAAISVLTPNDSGGGSSSGSSSSGGAGGSPEPAKNVQAKEISQAHVTSGKPVKFDFTKNATCVVYVSFDAKKTAGKTTTIAEQLKAKSTLVSNLSSGDVYKYFNLWVGNAGFATEKNIENPVVCFKVEKSWLQDKNIDQNSIALNRYNEKKWSQMPAKLLREDEKYLYFTAETPEFSFFAITGKAVEKEKVTETKPATDTSKLEQNGTTVSKTEQETGKGKATSIPGFGIFCGIICLIAVFLHKRK